MVHLYKEVAEFDRVPEYQPFTGVDYVLDDDEKYFVGDRTGRVLTVNSILKKWGTISWNNRAIAQDILTALTNNGQGFVYRPFSANDAILNPAAQLGDAVSVNGVVSQLCEINTKYDAMCAADISAPQSDEVDHEYPFFSPAERETKRELVALNALIKGARAVLNSVGTAKVYGSEADFGEMTLNGNNLHCESMWIGDEYVNVVTFD